MTANPCTTIINGAYFTIFEPTFPTTGLTVAESTISSIAAYDKALQDIFREPYSPTVTQATKNAQVASIAAPSMTVTTDGPGTFIVVRGMLIRDHESPTMMSTVTDKFVTPQPTALTPTMGAVHSGNYRIIVHGYYNDSPTGYVTAVSVDIQNNNQAFDVSAFSLTYEVQAGAATAHIIGTVKLTAGGTVLNVDDYLSLP